MLYSKLAMIFSIISVILSLSTMIFNYQKGHKQITEIQKPIDSSSPTVIMTERGQSLQSTFEKLCFEDGSIAIDYDYYKPVLNPLRYLVKQIKIGDVLFDVTMDPSGDFIFKGPAYNLNLQIKDLLIPDSFGFRRKMLFVEKLR